MTFAEHFVDRLAWHWPVVVMLLAIVAAWPTLPNDDEVEL